jgi:hypothetical protein
MQAAAVGRCVCRVAMWDLHSTMYKGKNTFMIVAYAAPIGDCCRHRRMQQRRVDGSQCLGCVRWQQEESTRLVVRWFLLEHLQLYHVMWGCF